LAAACGTVLTRKLGRNPGLHVDRAEVVADQATGRAGPIAAAQIRHYTSNDGVAGAGVIGGLHFEVADRADRPLGDRAIRGAANTLRLGLMS
jgi:hypothetical protein